MAHQLQSPCAGAATDSLESRAQLQRLRQDYGSAKALLREATKNGVVDESLRSKCRDAKIALKEVLEAGESVLGGPARSEPLSRVATGKRIEIPHAALGGVPSPLPQALQQQQVFSYDTLEYPFREAVAEVLQVSPSELPSLQQSSVFTRRWHAAQGGDARARFSALLHRFVTEFVAPRMLGSPIAYQKDVTMRVQAPLQEPMGYLHSDADYHHPPAEVNWWLPVTKVWGSNTLQVESQPGRGDFAPAELEYGEVLRFYGNLCQHYTMANSTDSCRVSFDFRVLHLPSHDVAWTDRRGKACTFQLGAFYQQVD